MKNRMISFGYGLINGKISVIKKEADIVDQIFADYINGNKLQDIADKLTREKVVFYMDNFIWNKNRVARIIEDTKYCGENSEYPAIIDKSIFEIAGIIKSSKGNKKKSQPKIVERAKNIVICNQCGHAMTRVSKWGTREKWICKNGCKNEVYISDKEIFNGVNTVVDAVHKNPRLIELEKSVKGYCSTPEIDKKLREINLKLNETKPDFQESKKLIMDCVKLRFIACEDSTLDAFNDTVIKETKRISENSDIDDNYLKKVVSRIKVTKEGNVIVRFINGIELNSGEVCMNGTNG